MGGLFLLMVGLGAWLSFGARHREDESIRRELLRQASNVASTLSQESIRELSFTAEDAERPAFQRLTEQLRAYSETTGIRSIYSLQLRDGQLFFGPESLLPDDPYATPPGTIYQEPSSQNLEIFRTAKPVVFGPISDEFGEFLSAIVPIVDTRSGEVLMVLGQDFEADDWIAQIHKAQMIPLLAILCPIGMLLLGYLAFKTCKRSPWCTPKRLRYVQVGTYFLVMLQLTVIASLFIRDIERKELRALFNAEANVQSQYYKETFNEIHRDLHLLVSFFEASQSVTHEEFREFCQPILDNNPIQACFWIPEWAVTNAAAFTAGIRAADVPDFSIRRFENGNRSVRESTDPIYPVVYVEPLSQRPAMLGYDFYSDPALREALLDALKSEFVSAGIVAARTPNTTVPAGLFVFEPVPHPRQGGLIGFCINTDEVIEHQQSDPSREIPSLSTTLFEVQSGKSPQPLSCSDCEHDSLECLKMLESDLSVTIPIFAFGKSFALLSTAEPQWFSAHLRRSAGITLVAGLVLTLLLTYIFSTMLGRPLLLEKLVQQRTHELAESKERFDIAISAAKLGVWERDVTTGRLIWNDRMLKIYGIRENEFDGDFHKWREYVHPHDQERVAQELTDTETGKKRFDTEFRIIRKDGETRHIRAFGKMMRDASGEPARMIGINQDITDMKMAQHAAAQERERLQFIFDALPIGISLNRTYGDGSETRMINDAHLRIAGIRRDQDNPETWRRINHPDNHADQESFMYETDGGRIKHFTVDKRYVHPDGRIVWVAFSRLRKILDDGGFEDLCTAVDITERKEAEEDLRESEERYRSTLNDLQVGVVVHAEDTRILLSNPEASRILGLSAAQLAGKPISDPAWKFIREDGSAMPVEEFPVNRVMSTGKSVFNQIVGIMKPGQAESTWVTVNAVRVFSDNSYLFRIIVNFMDITEQINTELSLKARNQELERFNKVAVGRELRMIELKKEINALCLKLGKKEPYPMATTERETTS